MLTKGPQPGASNSHTRPCHGVFTAQFIFRHILEVFSTKLESPPCLWAHSKYKISKRKTKRYQKAKNIIFRVCRFCWLVCGIQMTFKIRTKTVLKINRFVKTPWYERMKVARSGVWPLVLTHQSYSESREKRGHPLPHGNCLLLNPLLFRPLRIFVALHGGYGYFL